MGEGDLTGPLDEIRAKLELLKRLEAEHGFGVIIEEPAALEPIPEIPTGVTEVFGLFRRLEGTYFRFAQPDEIASPAAWANRTIDPYSPLGNPLVIGLERYSAPARTTDDFDGASVVYVDIEDGSVYYLDPDDYMFYSEHPDEEIEVDEFASDIVTFFNEYVLGEQYAELTETILGPGVRAHRIRKGKHEGQYTDSWMRLLVSANLAS